MYYLLPIPIPLSMCGAFAGLIGGGCNQFFPVWVGATTGASIGCILCICDAAMPESFRQMTTEREAEAEAGPVIVHNTYTTHVYGQPKDIQIAKVVV